MRSKIQSIQRASALARLTKMGSECPTKSWREPPTLNLSFMCIPDRSISVAVFCFAVLFFSPLRSAIQVLSLCTCACPHTLPSKNKTTSNKIKSIPSCARAHIVNPRYIIWSHLASYTCTSCPRVQSSALLITSLFFYFCVYFLSQCFSDILCMGVCDLRSKNTQHLLKEMLLILFFSFISEFHLFFPLFFKQLQYSVEAQKVVLE